MSSRQGSLERPPPSSPADSILSNDSYIADLSFDYVPDDDGNLVRKALRQTRTSSPPTPDYNSMPSPSLDKMAPVEYNMLESPLARSALARSESVQHDRETGAATGRNAFQRVASGPAGYLFPQRPATSLPSRGQPEPLDSLPARKRHTEELRSLPAASNGVDKDYLGEKENIDGNGDVDGHALDERGTRQSTSNAPARIIPSSSLRNAITSRDAAVTARKRQFSDGAPLARATPRLLGRSASKPNVDRTQEDGSNGDPDFEIYDDDGAGHQAASRPRRSASLSDALAIEGPRYSQPAPTGPRSRPGTSLGIRDAPPARRAVQFEERRSSAESNPPGGPPMRPYTAPHADHHAYTPHTRRTPSPDHSPPHTAQQRMMYSHKRRDSDTLRSGVAPSPTATTGNHRRSPTATQLPTATDGLQQAASRTVGDRDMESERNLLREKARALELENQRLQQQQQHVNIQQTTQRSVPMPLPGSKANIVVNKKVYARLGMIGKGGSSRVYRAMSSNNEIYAIKRVALDKTDQDTMQGFLNEISLLKRLEGHPRIITLVDSELKQGSGGTKGALCLVLELGEIDLAKLLGERQQQGFDMVWVAYYWQQMLQAVQILHDEKIVHSDLKPANFVLVKGQLKLIDFGIANAIANDTTNIQRDHQIGTVNYMSPEAIEIQEGMKRIKVGRPSDVWSLGCILYQMVYGHPPFQALHVYQKMKAIPDESYVIDFPAYVSRPPPKQLYPDHSPPAPPKPRIALRQDVLKTMKSCLTRNPKERMTIPELLEQDWVEMADTPPPRPALSEDETIISPHYMRQLIEYGIRLGQDTESKGMYTSEWLDGDAKRLIRELKKVIESEIQEAQAASSDAFAASGAA